MKTAILTSLTPELRTEWLDLWNDMQDDATAFNSPVWLEAAQKHLTKSTPVIVTVRDGKKLVAVAALQKYRMYGVSVYAAPALEFADKPSVLINWSRQAVVKALVAELKKVGTVYLSECSGEMTSAVKPFLEVPVIFQDDLNAVISFAKGPYGDLSSQALHKIHKRISKAEKEVTTSVSETDHTESLKTAYEIEGNSTKRAKGMSVLHRAEVRKFFESVAQSDPRLLRLITVKVGETPIAFSIDFFARGVYQGSQKAYVKGYDVYQPGKYMVLKLLEYYKAKGYKGFDLGRGYDTFKMTFTKDVHPLYTVVISDSTFRGRYLNLVRTLRDKAYHGLVKNPALYRFFKTVKVFTLAA